MGHSMKARLLAACATAVFAAATAGSASASPAAGVSPAHLTAAQPAATLVYGRGGGHGWGGGGRGWGGGGHGWRGGWGGGWGGPRYGLYYGGPAYSYASPYYYDDADCGYLRHRAVETGSGYWWRRYRACAG